MIKRPRNPERSFGVSVGAVLCVIAAVLLWRGRVLGAEVTAASGALLVVSGAAYPRILRWPSAWWWRMSRALGHVNARILLTAVFALVFVPMSTVWRLAGRDPLTRRRRTQSGWTPYPARYRDPRHYTRMY